MELLIEFGIESNRPAPNLASSTDSNRQFAHFSFLICDWAIDRVLILALESISRARTWQRLSSSRSARLGRGERQDAEVTVFTRMLRCCTVQQEEAVKISTRHEWRRWWDRRGCCLRSQLARSLRNATCSRNISCVESSTGHCLKDLAETVDEEDYQLQSSAGHRMFHRSLQDSQGMDEKCQPGEILQRWAQEI